MSATGGSGTRSVAAGRIAATAAIIAVLTVASRIVGFVRTLVFAGSVGATDLGAIYQTANTIPNIIFEIVAGGALAIIVVPLLAGPVAAGDRREVARIGSALLTWTLAVLIPIALAVAILAQPIVGLLDADAAEAQLAVGARMLRVFAIQLPLYGAGIVLTGILHAHHRFVWPVLAPLLSSVAVISAYLCFAVVDGPGTGVAQVSPPGELILSVGTTLGVAVLSGCLLIPVRSLRLRLRPRFALGADVRRRAVTLAASGTVVISAQWLTTAIYIRLANAGPEGTVVLFALTQAMFLLPWAALAVPLSTPTFPVLAEAAATGDRRRFDATLARTTRAVILATGLGVAGLIGLAVPLGRVLSALTVTGPAGPTGPTHPAPEVLTWAIVAFAPGVFGYALFTVFHRALNAAGGARQAAAAAVLGWGATVVAAAALSTWMPAEDRLLALGAANSVGMTVLGLALGVVVVRRHGASALARSGRAALVAVGAAGLAAAIGGAVARVSITPGLGGSIAAGMLAGVAVSAAYLAVTLALDPGDLRPVLRRAVRGAGNAVGRAVRRQRRL